MQHLAPGLIIVLIGVDHKIIYPLLWNTVRSKIALRYVHAQRIHLRIFLPGRLPLAGKHPVNEELRGMGMRCLGHHSHTAGTPSHDLPFFQRMWKQIHRKTLVLRFHDRLAAADVKENFALTQPICSLLQIPGELDISRSEERRVGKECSSRWSTEE